MKRKAMPSRKRIYNYWSSKDYAIDDNTCFKCGFTMEGRVVVERAHINAYCNTKDNAESNLHLLCPNCHKKSESWEGDSYWLWFETEEDFLSQERINPLPFKFYFKLALQHYKGEIEIDKELAKSLDDGLETCMRNHNLTKGEYIERLEKYIL